MNPPSNRVDKYGFPIPPTFDSEPTTRRARTSRGLRLWRGLLVAAFVGILISILMRSGLVEDGRKLLAGKLHERAIEKALGDDVRGALADVERAAALAPNEKTLLRLRAHLRLENDDLEGSLSDYNELIATSPQYFEYLGRSVVLQRLGRHGEAIDDLTKAIELGPEGAPTPLNNRAYARALAKVDLEPALEDVQRAIDAVDESIRSFELALQPDLIEFGPTQASFQLAEKKGDKASYLDTRGFLYYLLGRHQEALDDLNQAIDLATDYRRVLFSTRAVRNQSRPMRERMDRMLNESLAVMYHHRGQIHQALGHTALANDDLKHGDELGYNPSGGVF